MFLKSLSVQFSKLVTIALLSVFGCIEGAFATNVAICVEAGAVDLGSASACSNTFGTEYAYVDSRWLSADALVFVCTNYPGSGSSCGAGTYQLKRVSSVGSSDWLVNSAGAWFHSNVLPFGGTGGFVDVPDLSWAQWGNIMTSIVLLFTAVAVVRFLRNNF